MDITALVIALLGGGAAFKFLEYAIGLLANGGKNYRDELREEIKRLRHELEQQDKRMDAMQSAIDNQRAIADDWRKQFFEADKRAQLAETQVAARDEIIKALEYQLALLGYRRRADGRGLERIVED